MIGGEIYEGEPGLYLKWPEMLKTIIDGKLPHPPNSRLDGRQSKNSAFPFLYSAYPYNTKSNLNRTQVFANQIIWIQRIFTYTIGVNSYA